MYLYLGQDTMVNTRDIVGIFDLDTTSLSVRTREFLARAEKAGRVVVAGSELPKSFVLTGGNAPKVYISQLSSATIRGRVRQLRRENARFKKAIKNREK